MKLPSVKEFRQFNKLTKKTKKVLLRYFVEIAEMNSIESDASEKDIDVNTKETADHIINLVKKGSKNKLACQVTE